MSSYVFFVTVPTKEEGIKIANKLIESKLVACVNIIHDIHSIFWWKGAIEEDNEYLLIMKTTEKKATELIQTIETLHSYETPECIGFKIDMGSESYLKWIKNSIKE
ncbi:MAG: divalent-cation tolerance protein CutA [Promethearchaeota archaeon]|nr:MAG: divalent-cation tolerance protein CutA [Candidatus Lokiarchaeota archaeon]